MSAITKFQLEIYANQIVEKRTLLDGNEWMNFDGKPEKIENISYNKLPARA